MACALAVTFSGGLAATSTEPASAASYPTWDDVAKARKSESAAKAKIVEIRALLKALEVDVAETQAEAEKKGEEYQLADQALQEQAYKTKKLQKQASRAKKLANQSKKRAGEMVAQQYRSGSADVTTNLFVNASQADDILYSYGLADKFTEQTTGIYDRAIQDKNSAQSLTDQARVAKELREELRVEAEEALVVAQEAATKAQEALAEQEARKATLLTQLEILQKKRKATEKDYEAGVRARERAAAAAAAAAEAAANAGGGGGGGGGNGGEVSSSGWAKPGYGRITSSFGYRASPAGFHLGTDIGTGCGGGVYAAKSGTVSYAGWNGVYGNFIRVDHGGGVQTEYGHLNSIGVGYGASVGSGKYIGAAGATGGATGCHLHFGVRLNGLVTDPVPYMRDRGVTLG